MITLLSQYIKQKAPILDAEVFVANLKIQPIGPKQIDELLLKTTYPVCKYCGSSEITIDATANFNPSTQAWELVGTQDQCYCEECGGETTIKWKSVLGDNHPQLLS